MLSDAMLQKKFQISKDDATCGFAFKQLAIQNNIKIDEIECYDAFQCSFNYFDLQGNAQINNRSGVLLCTEKGMLALSASSTEMPITIIIRKQDIRVVEANASLFKASVRITDNNYEYEFKVSKKDISNIEKAINKTRNR